MEQHTCSVTGRSIYDEIISVFDELIKTEKELDFVNGQLEKGIDIDSNISLQAQLQ